MKDFPFVESILRQVFNLKDDSAIFASTSLEQTNESGTPEDVAFSFALSLNQKSARLPWNFSFNFCSSSSPASGSGRR